MEFDKQKGEFLVKAAREIIESHVKGEEIDVEFPTWCNEKRGLFVTIETYPSHELRGCIGIPLPVKSISEALVECAIEACHDPRFPPVSKSELDGIVVEVSLLTEPKKIEYNDVEDLLEQIKAGVDGVILRCKGKSALFLPQVWEKLPEKESFLSHLCLKAGLSPHAWRSFDCEFFKFRVVAWREKEPRGEVECVMSLKRP